MWKMRSKFTGSRGKRLWTRIQPPVLDKEILVTAARLQKTRQQPRQRRFRLAVLLFERGAKNARKIADVLGDQEVCLHEGFHRTARIGVVISHLFGERRLEIEGQSLLCASAQIVKPDAYVPQKGFRLAEGFVFVARENAMRHERRRIVFVVKIFADPIECLKIAQAALAILDIGLDEISALSLPFVADIPFGKFGFHEVNAGHRRRFGAELFAQVLKQFPVAGEIARFNQCRKDGHVLLCKAQGFRNGAGRVANL